MLECFSDAERDRDKQHPYILPPEAGGQVCKDVVLVVWLVIGGKRDKMKECALRFFMITLISSEERSGF